MLNTHRSLADVAEATGRRRMQSQFPTGNRKKRQCLLVAGTTYSLIMSAHDKKNISTSVAWWTTYPVCLPFDVKLDAVAGMKMFVDGGAGQI
jgi:hypothetical protein